MITIVVAHARNGVIGRDGGLPWYLPTDLQHFKRLTQDGTVIMGRRTWESLGAPLPRRRNIVISRSCIAGVEAYTSLPQALRQLDGSVFLIGGALLYKEGLLYADRMVITKLDTDVEGDTYFPAFDQARWQEISNVAGEPDTLPYSIVTYDRVRTHNYKESQ